MAHSIHEAVGFRINRTAIILRNGFTKVLKPFGIAPEQFSIMVLLQEQPDISQTEIANILVKDKTTITRLIDSVEKKGYLSRERVEGNRRAHRVFLTPEGEKVIDEVYVVGEKHKQCVNDAITPEEKAQLFKILEKLENIELG